TVRRAAGGAGEAAEGGGAGDARSGPGGPPGQGRLRREPGVARAIRRGDPPRHGAMDARRGAGEDRTPMRTGTMKGWWIRTEGGTIVLEQRDAPVPRPGPGQLSVRIRAAALNRGEFIAGHGL